MRYDNPELLRELAAEYVIGTLRGAARRRFEVLVEQNAALRLHKEFWEQRLAEFGQVVPPVPPPASARTALLQRAGATTAVPVRRGRRRNAWAWAAGFAAAASLALAFLLGRHYPAVPVSALSVAAAPEPEIREAWPIYAGQVRMPASSTAWLLSLSPDHQHLIAVAANDFVQGGRSQLQLWCLVAGVDPVPMGVLPSERDASVSFDIPPSIRGRGPISFAITLEPPGLDAGAAARPSRPVLDQSPTLLDSI